MTKLIDLLESVKNVSIDSVKLPETIFDSEVNFKGDGVFIEGHIISFKNENKEIAFAGNDENVWYINVDDIMESDETDNKIENLDGIPVKIKIKKDAVIRAERKLIVGKHIIGQVSGSDAETLRCDCKQNCSNGGFCCSQGGWIYVCEKSSCVFSNNRC